MTSIAPQLETSLTNNSSYKLQLCIRQVHNASQIFNTNNQLISLKVTHMHHFYSMKFKSILLNSDLSNSMIIINNAHKVDVMLLQTNLWFQFRWNV